MADVVSGYLSMIDNELPRIIERLRTVQIVQRPALDVIRTWDSADTLIYCDPPYLHSTRHEGSRSVYGCEMSEVEHRELADVLIQCKSRVVLSGYPSALYTELYRQWKAIEFDMPNHAAGGRTKARKQETIWLNW
jgi:DNA adenine methylase